MWYSLCYRTELGTLLVTSALPLVTMWCHTLSSAGAQDPTVPLYFKYQSIRRRRSPAPNVPHHVGQLETHTPAPSTVIPYSTLYLVFPVERLIIVQQVMIHYNIPACIIPPGHLLLLGACKIPPESSIFTFAIIALATLTEHAYNAPDQILHSMSIGLNMLIPLLTRGFHFISCRL